MYIKIDKDGNLTEVVENFKVTEKMEIEEWLDNYDRICNEKMRCDRLQIDCHHNIAELDKIALNKIRKLSEINTAMANL